MEAAEIIQGTYEWRAVRLGKVTGSRMADVMMTPDKAGYRNYLAQLAAERITGNVEETFCSYDMQRGTELEPVARSLYEFLNRVEVTQVGFIDHPTIQWLGISPDGLVGADGMTEFKCPKSAQHQDLLLGGKIDSKYIKQMNIQMSCAGRKWCDYGSYDPTMPAELQLWVTRVFRDHELVGKMEAAAISFLAAVEKRVAAINALMNF